MAQRTHRTARTRVLRIGMLALVAAGACAPTGSVAAQGLPQVLVERLEGQRDAANAALRAQRVRVAKAAAAHQLAQGTATRLGHQGEVVEQLVDAFPGAPRTAQILEFDNIVTAAERDALVKRELLDDATDTASRAQGVALDADRRVRALARAAATEDDVDADIGSYRFGSGGPSVSAASLDAYLQSKASPISGSGTELLEAGIKYDIDPRLIVAIAGAESYFGLTLCAPHNAWGWGCPSSPYRFDSWGEGIDAVARGLRENYLDDGLTNVGEIHLRYAPPAAKNDPNGLNYAWPDNVARFLVEQGGDPQSVAGLLKSSR